MRALSVTRCAGYVGAAGFTDGAVPPGVEAKHLARRRKGSKHTTDTDIAVRVSDD